MTVHLKKTLLLFCMLISALLYTSPVKAAEPPPPPEPGVSNEFCLACHGTSGTYMMLENGDFLDLYIDPQEFAQSVHGESGYACVQCHTTITTYPHPSFDAVDHRDAAVQLYTSCQRCHSGEYALTLDSAHEAARIEGNTAAALCSDCHRPHRVQRMTDAQTGILLSEARTHIPQTCAQCHSLIYEKYLTSVHGAALIEENNTYVPTCIDCHGVHNIEDPLTASFRLNSPNVCAKCHTDPELMDKYDLSTRVLETYVADFHGTTVVLFEKQSPDAETNKPVCFDCHGVHDIKPIDHPEKGLHVRENLLARCQVCHPDATINFPDAWLSHYIPTIDDNPIVYWVNLFYKLFIPGVLSSMAILVLLDFTTKIRKRKYKLGIPWLNSLRQRIRIVDDVHKPPGINNIPSPSETTSITDEDQNDRNNLKGENQYNHLDSEKADD